MNINDRIIEGILVKMADRMEKNAKTGAKWLGRKAKEGLGKLGYKAAHGAGKLVGKAIKAFKHGPTHTVGEKKPEAPKQEENSTYDRIIDMLLEARVEMFIEDRLDEKKLIGKQKKLDVNKSGKLDAQDFKMLRSGKRADEAKVKPSGTKELQSKYSDANLGAKALRKAGEARRSGNKPEARKQVEKAKKLDKPQLP